MNTLPRNALSNTLSILAVAASMTGCYVVPIGPDGQPAYPIAPYPQAGVPAPTPVPIYAGPLVLQARLYPMNDIANQTGMLSGTITARPGGKGNFQLQYNGDILSGEATRVSNDERRGIASAFGPGGLSMSCEYQMMSQRQGAGTCTFSNGARYQVHVGT